LAILEAVSRGEITPGEGKALADLLAAYLKGLETDDQEERLKDRARIRERQRERNIETGFC